EPQPRDVSCGSGGDCVVTGSVFTNDGTQREAFIAEERDGRWDPALTRVIPGITTLGPNSSDGRVVSCASGGNCVAAGTYFSAPGPSQTRSYVAEERNGSWSFARPITVTAAGAPGSTSSQVSGVSCTVPGTCAVIGTSEDANGRSEVFRLN